MSSRSADGSTPVSMPFSLKRMGTELEPSELLSGPLTRPHPRALNPRGEKNPSLRDDAETGNVRDGEAGSRRGPASRPSLDGPDRSAQHRGGSPPKRRPADTAAAARE